jgi:hypothetical protein
MTCDKTPLQAIVDEGLEPLYAAIAQAAQEHPAHETWGLHRGNPVEWYVQKRLNWQAVTTTGASIFTEYHGAVELPLAWQLFLRRMARHFAPLGRDPKLLEVYAWTLTKSAQELLEKHSEITDGDAGEPAS